MRPDALLLALVFLAVSTVCALAGNQPQQPSPSQQNPAAQSSGAAPRLDFTLPSQPRTFKSSSERRDASSFDAGIIVSPFSPVQFDPALWRDSTCYAMRTYIVAREDNSDSTRPVGYTTCLPGRKVQMKNADARRK